MGGFMINSRKLIKYSSQDHAVYLFITDLDRKLRAVRSTRIDRVLTVVLYDKIKENKGFFSPKQYKPAREPGIDWYYQPSVATWFTEPMMAKLVDELDEYGYSLRVDVHDSLQFDHAFKLTITW
jgi:hypothetical protein